MFAGSSQLYPAWLWGQLYALCSASLEIFRGLTSAWVWPAADSGNRPQVRGRTK